MAYTIPKTLIPSKTVKFNPEHYTVGNILECYYNATANELRDGMSWYSSTQDEIERTFYSFGLAKAAALVAVLSPSLPWERNIKEAIVLAKAYSQGIPAQDVRSSAYGANKLKAYAILAMPDTANNEELFTVLKGPKVQSFAKNMSGYAQVVTIDGHAVNIALGVADTSIRKVHSPTAKQYTYIAELYRAAASVAGIEPRQMQAVTWLTHRRIKNELSRKA